MKTSIILIPLSYSNARIIANQIEGLTYKTTTALRLQLANELELEDENEKAEDVEIYDLSDLTQALNDCTVDTDNNYFAYVYFE